MKREMKLGMFLRPAGHHVAGWRHPEAQSDAGWNFQRFAEMAKTAEEGMFDMLFLADTAAVPSDDFENLSKTSYVAWLEPFSVMAALAPITRRIGLVCTASTTFNEPYNIARKFASLDIISNGRSGWNLVTSANPIEALNFNLSEHVPRDLRYARAREFADVVRGLWDSWEADAFTVDKLSGVFFDPNKLHPLNHKGRFFQVKGPLNVAHPKHGHPVVVQAGASEDGKQLAAETADVVFAAQPTLDGAKEFYRDVKARLDKFGRSPEDLVIMPGFQVVVGESQGQAEDKAGELQELILPEVGLRHLSQYIGYDLSAYPLDGPVPELEVPKDGHSRTELLVDMARKEGLTIRQLYKKISGARGHYQTHGTPGKIADEMQEWFEGKAADGFNLIPPVLPRDLNEFVRLVVPELQRRGIFRRSYETETLKGNLGIAVAKEHR